MSMKKLSHLQTSLSVTSNIYSLFSNLANVFPNFRGGASLVIVSSAVKHSPYEREVGSVNTRLAHHSCHIYEFVSI